MKELEKIAKEISTLEKMPEDENYFEACFLVAKDLYNLNDNSAYKVADIIQEKFLKN